MSEQNISLEELRAFVEDIEERSKASEILCESYLSLKNFVYWYLGERSEEFERNSKDRLTLFKGIFEESKEGVWVTIHRDEKFPFLQRFFEDGFAEVYPSKEEIFEARRISQDDINPFHSIVRRYKEYIQALEPHAIKVLKICITTFYVTRPLPWRKLPDNSFIIEPKKICEGIYPLYLGESTVIAKFKEVMMLVFDFIELLNAKIKVDSFLTNIRECERKLQSLKEKCMNFRGFEDTNHCLNNEDIFINKIKETGEKFESELDEKKKLLQLKPVSFDFYVLTLPTPKYHTFCALRLYNRRGKGTVIFADAGTQGYGKDVKKLDIVSGIKDGKELHYELREIIKNGDDVEIYITHDHDDHNGNKFVIMSVCEERGIIPKIFERNYNNYNWECRGFQVNEHVYDVKKKIYKTCTRINDFFKITVFAPPFIGSDMNESSLAIQVDFLHEKTFRKILFTGDMTRSCSSFFFKNHQVDLMVAPHHGSMENFVEPSAIQAEKIVVTSGKKFNKNIAKYLTKLLYFFENGNEKENQTRELLWLNAEECEKDLSELNDKKFVNVMSELGFNTCVWVPVHSKWESDHNQWKLEFDSKEGKESKKEMRKNEPSYVHANIQQAQCSISSQHQYVCQFSVDNTKCIMYSRSNNVHVFKLDNFGPTVVDFENISSRKHKSSQKKDVPKKSQCTVQAEQVNDAKLEEE
ncbi:hypothetical protein PCE1_000687 [Barthelona sp. PCE]